MVNEWKVSSLIKTEFLCLALKLSLLTIQYELMYLHILARQERYLKRCCLSLGMANIPILFTFYVLPYQVITKYFTANSILVE